MSLRPWSAAAMLVLAACGDVAPTAAQANASPASANAASPAALTDPASGAQCAGSDVRITRDGFSLVLDGDCGEVVITGSHGSVNLSRAASIRVEGNHVTVLNEEVGKVEVAGDDNILNMTVVGPLAILGDRNMVLAREISALRFEGRDNTVNPDNTPALEDSGTGNRLL
ncbi:DUF3060 domain-containing protein [Luteimonas saliphila]|uniref:DUF3060 domain-containing protein n=1 Tax=Luteimonas saliphila TaxID=2804919 RepID=UPI00192DBAD9|nr:DUF3060 domain-containing protein [Luteimonas saliphila]